MKKLESDIVFNLKDDRRLKVRKENEKYFIYKNEETEPFLIQEEGETADYHGFVWTTGSIQGYLSKIDNMCFGGDELVLTDQGEIPISNISLQKQWNDISFTRKKKRTKI